MVFFLHSSEFMGIKLALDYFIYFFLSVIDKHAPFKKHKVKK